MIEINHENLLLENADQFIALVRFYHYNQDNEFNNH